MSLGRLLTLVLAYLLDAWDSNLGSKFTSFRLDLGQLSPTLTNFFSKIEKKVSYQFFCHIEFFSKPIVDEFFFGAGLVSASAEFVSRSLEKINNLFISVGHAFGKEPGFMICCRIVAEREKRRTLIK